MKYKLARNASWQCLSPSMRREWIEMILFQAIEKNPLSLPPCGGSGLKYDHDAEAGIGSKSPSMRREWIEIVR